MAKTSQRGPIITRTSTSGGLAILRQLPVERTTVMESMKEQPADLDTLRVATLRSAQYDHRSQMHHQFHLRANIPTYLDDFKQGLPKKGLASVSNQWWGLEEREGLKLGEVEEEDYSLWADGEADFKRSKLGAKGAHKEERIMEDAMPAATLARTRKRAALRGRKVLGLAGTRGYGTYRLSDKDRALLRAVFEDSLPDLWKAYLAF